MSGPDAVLDAHHHLWDPGGRAYAWLDEPALARIRRPYRLDDLRRHTAREGVVGTVLVQTVSEVAETEEFLDIAAGSGGLVAGVVGWVDLAAPDVADTLARLAAHPGNLVGIRHQAHDEPDPGWLVRPGVLRGLRAVRDAGLAYDLLVRTPQLAAARQAAERVPELRFVLDHAAKPPIASGRTEPWAAGVAALARLPNVWCKLSGLVTEASWDDWDAARIAPYADLVLAGFGPERVMVGSDWPVCELAASYADVLALARHLTRNLSTRERSAVFHRTARRAYRLPPRS